ncbi:pilus assembly PilX family protein [Luteimonas sp. A277]
MSRGNAQRGASLIVVLLLLLVVTLLGLASLRSTLLQERMAGNLAARSNTFHVAEAVLREAEGWAASKPTAPTNGCVNGVCARFQPTVKNPTRAPWEQDGFWETGGSGFKLASEDINGVRAQYVVEDFGMGVDTSCTASIDMSAAECEPESQMYRITVRSKAPDGAAVMLQSLYEVP